MNLKRLFVKLPISTLKKKILVYLILFTTIPFLAFMSFMLFYSRSSIEKETLQMTAAINSRCADMINRDLAICVEKSNFIISNRYITAYLQKNFNDDLEDIFSFHETVNAIFSSMDASSGIGQRAVKIYTENETLFPGNYIEWIDTLKEAPVYKKIEAASLADIIWRDDVVKEGEGKRNISMFRNLEFIGKSVGVLKVDYPFSKVEYYMNSVGAPDGGLIVYQDKDGNTVYIKKSAGVELPEGERFDTGSYIFTSNVLMNGHKLITSIPITLVQSKYRGTIFIFLGTFTILTAIIFFISSFTSRKITTGLNEFIHEIGSNDDILLNEQLIHIEGNDEISLIKERFIGIIKRMNTLYEELYISKLQNSSLELDLLQSRINPHLLYNSLSVIKWAAVENNDQKTINIIDTMTRYYRAALNKGNNVLSIKDEILMLEEYVKINGISRNRKYTLAVEVDDQVLLCHTFKHLLQPIVENAILHAFSQEDDAMIIIKGYFEGEDIIFQVKDNGHGMDEEMLDSIMNFNYKSQYGGYGLKNVMKRIQAYYGDNYGMDIKSKKEEGTIVTIKIANVDEKELNSRYII